MDFDAYLIDLLVHKIREGAFFSRELVASCYDATKVKFHSMEDERVSEKWINQLFIDFSQMIASKNDFWKDTDVVISQKLYRQIARK
ncbi:hypothetical protein [Rheinheimera texasensis]|uniref:hypothetical protein n=1 Tax=Rheinheimera texasensis TaxID=306205 RepID=UPI0032B121FF